MKETKEGDTFLEKYVRKYDDWLSKGLISFSSKVIPVPESLNAEKWVLPTEQAIAILKTAQSLALKKCLCRVHYKRCDNPEEVCLLLNEAGEKFIAKGQARKITLPEAVEVLRKANENGLVHQTFYMPDHQIFALCSCCSCCCHDLQIVKLFGRKELQVRSEYVAVTDPQDCVDCGECAGRCVFEARTFRDGRLTYHASACMGCGLCITVCPVEATHMELRKS